MATETESLILKIDNSQAISAADAFTIACLKAEQAVVLADRQIRAAEAGFNRMAAGQERATRVAAQAVTQIERLRTETRNHAQAVAEEVARVAQAVEVQTRHNAVTAQAVTRMVELAQAQRNVGNETERSTRRNNEAASSLRGMLSTIAALAGGLSIAMGARTAVANTAQLETALVGVAKTTNLSGAALEDYKRRIDELSARTPVATVELLNIGQAAGQLGVRGSADLARFTETVAKLQAATDIQGGDGAKKLARLIGINGEDVGTSITAVGAAITRLGNESRASESEILGNAETVAQATAQYRIGSVNALALGAAMKSLGNDAEVGGTSVGRTMDVIDKAIRKPGPQMQVLQKLTGQTADEIENLFRTDPTAQFARFIGGLNAAGRAGEDVKGVLEALGLEDIRIQRVLPTLGGAYGELAVSIQKAREEGERQQALNAESAKAFETLAAKSQMAKNVIGLMADGAVKPATFVMKGLLDAIRGLSTESPALQATIMGVTSALTALAAVQVVSTLLGITRAIQGVTGALGVMRLATLSNPWGLLLVGAAAVIGVMVSLRENTNAATEAIERQKAAAESFAPIAAALADAEAKQKSATMLKDPSLAAASLEQRLAAIKNTLDMLNADGSKISDATGTAMSGVTAQDVKRLIQTPQGRAAFNALSYEGSNGKLNGRTFEDTVATAPGATGALLNAYVPSDQFKAAAIAEIQALEALKQKMQETGQVRQGTGADIEAQRAKLQSLLTAMQDEEKAAGMSASALQALTMRRELEKDMTDAQKAALGDMVTKVVDQAAQLQAAKDATQEAAKANQEYERSLERMVEASDKAGQKLQDLIDKTNLEIDTLRMGAEERTLYIAQIEATKLAEEEGTFAGFDLLTQYIERTQLLAQMKTELADVTAATEEAARADEALQASQLAAAENLTRMMRDLDEEIELAGLDADAQERRAAAYRAVEAAMAAGQSDKQADATGRIVEAQVASLQRMRETRNMADALGSDVAGVFSRLTDSTLTWDNAMKALNDTGKQVLQTFLQYAAIQPLARGLANVFMPLAGAVVGGAAAPGAGPSAGGDPTAGIPSSALFNAHGNMILAGSLVPFARGGLDQGIYSSAAIFPLNNGRVGVVGEAGRDEMVAKPVRLPNGDLGVRAIGGGGTVNHYSVNVSVDARGATRDSADAFRRSGRQVAGQIQRGLRG